MVINWFRRLVTTSLPLHILVLSLSASAADSGFFKDAKLTAIRPFTAPDISLGAINKQKQSVDYEQHVTLIHFWASWCLPCQKELPLIEKLQQDYRHNDIFQVITIAADSYKNIDRYIKKNNTQLTVLIDQYGEVLRDFRVKALPGSYLIDKHGLVRYQVVGPIDWDSNKVKSTLNSLLETAYP